MILSVEGAITPINGRIYCFKAVKGLIYFSNYLHFVFFFLKRQAFFLLVLFWYAKILIDIFSVSSNYCDLLESTFLVTAVKM